MTDIKLSVSSICVSNDESVGAACPGVIFTTFTQSLFCRKRPQNLNIFLKKLFVYVAKPHSGEKLFVQTDKQGL